MTSTTLTSWALLIWQALENSGCDAKKVFTRVGLDSHALGVGDARFDMLKMQDLWRESVLESGLVDFGVEVGKLWSPTTFHALGFAWLASSSLSDGLRRLTRYSQIINDAVQTYVKKVGGFYELGFVNGHQSILIESASLDAATVALVKMSRMLCGESFSPESVQLYSEPSASVVPLEAYLRCPVSYVNSNQHNHPLIEFKLDAYLVEKDLPTGNQSLVRVNESLLQEYISSLAKASFTNRATVKITEYIPAGNISEVIVAKSLNLSSRSLQRKLLEEGTSYSALLNEIRRDTATFHLKNSQLSLSEIAFLLGFSEQANFTRAFKRWHELSPSEYRKQLNTKTA